MTLPINFKANAFRANRSHQYADQLWLKSIATIASPSTTGKTDSVSAAYLPNGDTAIPTVFGVLSWKAPNPTTSAECSIKLQSTNSAPLVTAATFTSERALFSGTVHTASGVEIGNQWRIAVDPVSSSLVFEKANAVTGAYEVKHSITSL